MSARAASARRGTAAPPATAPPATAPPATAPPATAPPAAAPATPAPTLGARERPLPRRRPRAQRSLARPRRWLPAAFAAGALLGVLAGVATWLLLDSRSADAPAVVSRDRVVALDGASVTVPAGWAPARAAQAGVPELAGSFAVFAPVPGLRAYAVVTLTRRDLPAALQELLGPLGPTRAMRLAGLPALAYRARPVSGDRTAELTVARTADAVLAVACIARTEAWAGATGCAKQIGPGTGALAPAQ